MNEAADARLHRLLGGDQLASLRKRLRRRFERSPVDRPLEYIRIGGLAAAEHAALASLIGRPQRYSKSLQIDLRAVDTIVQRSGIAASLREALERLDGPIANVAARRLALETLWSNVICGCQYPDLVRLLRTPEGIGLLKRLSKQDAVTASQLCRRADAVLRQLPAKGLTRSQLAAETLGDAHALDNGQPVATIVLAAWRRLAGAGSEHQLTETERDPQAAVTIERTRDIWASAGVLVNELARPVLFLNLPTRSSEQGAWRRGEPSYLSLQALLRSPPSWDVAGRKVYVCENPNLIAIAADKWGQNCAPLACTDGMPAAAQRTLLSQLAQAGARLCYHGDFDWPGLRIGNYVIRKFGAEPWRFSAADYLAAIPTIANLGQSIQGTAVEACWDTALAAAIQQQRMFVAEEAHAPPLLRDLDSRCL
ncbi:MAG TPA: TIGR02679 family protein [Xanthobacteraceae bacterium]|jgi:uncharacterized protein (TIGR02679 family)